MIKHLSGDVVLELAVLNAAGIPDDMKALFPFMLYHFGDIGKIFRQIVMVRSQTERTRQRLKAGVAMTYGVQRADPRMRLGMFGFWAGPDGSQTEQFG